MKTQEIKKEQIRPFVQKAYESDSDCVEKWHITSGKGLKHCVDRTVSDLEELKTLKFYVVTEMGNFVGYFGTEYNGQYLPTIFVMPHYRNQKDLFWKEIEKKVANPFRAGCFTKNIPCCKFYAKKGKEIARIKTNEGEATLFNFKRDNKCH
jgi:hypothetical protein